MRAKSVALILCVFLAGCVEMKQQGSLVRGLQSPTVVFRSDDSSYILTCLHELASIGEEEFQAHLESAVEPQKGSSDQEILRYVCLHLDPRAEQAKFKQGMAVLEAYIATHPDGREGMLGLQALADRLDQEKKQSSAGQKKILAEKKVLLAEIETMRDRLTQEQVRVEELQNQIEELKNIENVIKSREQ